MADPWATLILGDWRDHADELRALSPDACITDPPYGIGIKGAGVGRRIDRGLYWKARVPFEKQVENWRGSPAMLC